MVDKKNRKQAMYGLTLTRKLGEREGIEGIFLCISHAHCGNDNNTQTQDSGKDKRSRQRGVLRG